MSERPPVVVGLDIGTTSTKAVAFDAEGEAWGEAEHGYPTHHPAPGHVEQDPDEVVDEALGALSDASRAAAEAGARVVAVGVSTVMHSLIGLGADDRPRTAMLTFADSRAAAQAAAARDEHGLAIYRRTGTPLHPMSPLLKLRWFDEEDPGTAADVTRWISIKEHLLAGLFGAGSDASRLIDHSVASATGLFNLSELDWDDAALEMAGVQRSQLSTPVPTRHRLDGLGADMAERLHLEPGTPVVIGASDGVLANLGVGAIRPGVMAATIGTSGALRVAADTPATDPQGRTFCYVLTAGEKGPDRFIIGGAVSNGGSILEWLRARLLATPEAGDTETAIEALLEEASSVPPGAKGLVMLPYLDGERAPRWTAGLSGALLGLRSDHGRRHVVRAALEGVMLQLRLVLNTLVEAVGQPEAIRATGGFTRSDVLTQMMADVFNQPINLLSLGEASALGAALLAMEATDLVSSLDDTADLIETERTVAPDADTSAVYEQLAGGYERLVESLMDAGVWQETSDLAARLTDGPT